MRSLHSLLFKRCITSVRTTPVVGANECGLYVIPFSTLSISDLLDVRVSCNPEVVFEKKAA